MLLAAALAAAIPACAGDQQGTDDTQQASTTEKSSTTQPAAERAAPQPTPKPTLGNATPGQRNSLAAAAARIRLQRPPQEGGGGAVVINNDNLRQVAAEGNVSEAGGVSGGDAVAAAPAAAGPAGDQEGAANPASALVSEYLAQKRTVDGLKERLANFDKQIAQPATDPHYSQSQNTPQNRAPGVVDPAQKQRGDLAKQLADEQAKLEAIRARARREGVELSSSK